MNTLKKIFGLEKKSSAEVKKEKGKISKNHFEHTLWFSDEDLDQVF